MSTPTSLETIEAMQEESFIESGGQLSHGFRGDDSTDEDEGLDGGAEGRGQVGGCAEGGLKVGNRAKSPVRIQP